MQRVLGGGMRLAALLLAAICLYTGLMLVAYSFPDEWISDNVGAAVGMLTEESNMVGGYANYFWHTSFSITDNLTDIRIYEGLLRGGRSVTDAAMRTDYARYWHGYAVVLRPLMIVLSIVNIRYLNMMGLMALFLVCGWKCRERFGWRTAAHFCGGLLMSFLLIAPFLPAVHVRKFPCPGGQRRRAVWMEGRSQPCVRVFPSSGVVGVLL